MRSLNLIVVASAVALAAAIAQAGESARAGQQWAERLQVSYDAARRSVSRVRVRVVDPHPEKNLDFVWEPAAGNWPGIDPLTNAATGKGRLVWRVRGSVNYDPRTVYSTYVGEMRAGRPEGLGRLELRSGAFFDGTWKAGLLEGRGTSQDEQGNRYEGWFVAGRAGGEGRLLARDGSIYEGSFRDGRRHGTGTMRLAGGTVYKSQWRDGIEIGSARPDVLADATVGGLVRAQSGGGDAGKVNMSVIIDQRITSQQEIQYQHLVRDEDVAIFPVDQAFNDAWSGTAVIRDDDYVYARDWDRDHAYVQVDLETTDGSRVKLDGMSLEVVNSFAYRKPMLTLQKHAGCVAFRPTFNFVNWGWGGVRNPQLHVRFTSPERPGEASPTYSLPLADFEDGADVSLLEPLQQAGVDTDSLANGRFQCQSRDQLGVCRAQVFNSVGFGEIAEFVHGEDILSTTASGEIEYQYADDAGNTYPMKEPFEVDLMLAVIEIPEDLAECGDGGYPPSEALRYLDVKLPVNQSGYSVAIPVRGNKNVKDYTARLKISSEMSAFHQFTATAHFSDGSVRHSKPVSLFYFRQRWPSFVSDVPLPACYLDPGFGSSC
jgi:hypothetical protein